jgi:phosphoribosylglycinamide formyltransferase-1
MIRLGILISGRGSNFVAIADNIAKGKLAAQIAVVISNQPDAAGISAARERGLKCVVLPSRGVKREEHDRAVAAALREAGAELIILAGYMRLLSPWFISEFAGKILNIHPSLLPAFPGLEAQRQALEYGVQVSGCTVHFVDEHLDHGAIILQKTVPVLPTDDEHTLADRILVQEHIAYSEGIALVASGKYRIEGRRVLPAGATAGSGNSSK